MPWTSDEQEAACIKKAVGDVLKNLPRLAGNSRQCWITAMQLTPGPELRAARFKIEALKTNPSTAARMKVGKRFVTEQEWTAINQRPVKDVQHNPPERTFSGGGKPTMTGLMRIDAAVVEGILVASGRDGGFVEPLNWLEAYRETCRRTPQVRSESKMNSQKTVCHVGARSRGQADRSTIAPAG